MEDEVDGTGMVFHEQPVAHVLALAIDGQRLAMADVVDKQGYQLLGKLIGAVVVRAVGHDDGHSVGVVEGAHKVVARSLRGAVGRVRVILCALEEELVAVGQVMLGAAGRGGEWRFDAVRVRQFQCSIDLIGRNMIESLALILLWQRLPVELGGLQQAQSAHHVGAGESEGVLDAAVHVALRGQVNDAVHLLLLHQPVEGIEVADVHLDKLVVGFRLHILQVGQVASVCQLVEVDDVVLGILVHKQAHYMAANKACTTSNYYCSFHNFDHELY